MRSGQPYQLLPLPAGMASSSATDISDTGVVVGQVGPYYSPEFSGRATAWYPDGLGSYTVQLLGALPGQTIGSATAVNNRGDIVGYSSDGTYRYPVFFRAPGDIVDLTSTGIFDPVDINESRVIVDQSFTAKRFDLDTMIAEDLGAPAPPGGSRYVATRASSINESNQVAGSAILATSTDCDRQVSRYTDGVGWEIFSSCGRYNGASDINDGGDMVMLVIIAPYVRLEGGGTFAVESLIVNGVGHWYAVTTTAGWINNSRQMVIYATNPTTGETGALLLTPEATEIVAAPPAGGDPASQIVISAEPNPFQFQAKTTIRFSLPMSGPVDLAIYDAAGRRVDVVLAGAWRDSGPNEVAWDGRDEAGARVARGAYFARLRGDGSERTAKLVIR
jgi:probable HAF family extracellular repeat protein